MESFPSPRRSRISRGIVAVVDASVVVVALADDGPDGDAVRRRLRGEQLLAPEIMDLEVLSVLRRAVSRGTMSERRAGLALDDLREVPIQRVPHRRLLARCWELRDNLTPYDAAYVAAAEAYSMPSPGETRWKSSEWIAVFARV